MRFNERETLSFSLVEKGEREEGGLRREENETTGRLRGLNEIANEIMRLCASGCDYRSLDSIDASRNNRVRGPELENLTNRLIMYQTSAPHRNNATSILGRFPRILIQYRQEFFSVLLDAGSKSHFAGSRLEYG